MVQRHFTATGEVQRSLRLLARAAEYLPETIGNGFRLSSSTVYER